MTSQHAALAAWAVYKSTKQPTTQVQFTPDPTRQKRGTSKAGGNEIHPNSRRKNGQGLWT